MWNNAVNAWWPLLFYAAPDAPRFRKGMIAMLGTCAATLAVTALVWGLERREHRLRSPNNNINTNKNPRAEDDLESDTGSDKRSTASKSRPRSDNFNLNAKVAELGSDADVRVAHTMSVDDSLGVDGGGMDVEKGWTRSNK